MSIAEVSLSDEYQARLLLLEGEAKLLLDDVAEARRSIRGALRLLPEEPWSERRHRIRTKLRMQLVSILLAEGKVQEARDLYHVVRKDFLVAHNGDASHLIGRDAQLGYWEEAHLTLAQESLVHPALRNLPTPPSCEAAAALLAGGLKHLAILPAGGFGDILQTLQFAAALNRRAERITWWLPENIACLAAERLVGSHEIASFRYDQVVEHWSESPDLVIVGDGLPHLLGVQYSAIPFEPACLVGQRVRAPDQPLRVGFAWKGASRTVHDAVRSSPLSAWTALLGCPGVEWIPLQPERTKEEESALARSPQVADPGSLPDFEATAKILEQVDLVITVDTSVGHLAGVLGLPTWLLLAPGCDGRWGPPGGDHCVWYQHHRLWWRMAGWEDLLARVGAGLGALANDHRENRLGRRAA